jgi:[protein-PII] uridylyltransferase
LESFVGFDRLTILSFDRMGFFADITGCISSEGYGILSARVYSTQNGRILDIFNVEPDGVTHIPSEDRIENIKRKWARIVSGSTTTQQMLDERMKLYPQKKSRIVQKQPSVRIDNDISKTFTVLDIEAQDSFGLLYRMTRILSNHGINIVSARLSTRIDRAADMFYVTDKKNSKITDEHIIAAITEDLTKAVSAG